MKILTPILIALLINSCGSNKKKSIDFKPLKLNGTFNKEQNYWTSNEESYKNVIFDNDTEYATISKIKSNDEPSGLGLINRKGELIIPAVFNGLRAGFDQNGFCKVQKNGKYGLYNKNGVQILEPEYDDIYNDLDLSQKLIKVTKNKLSGLVNFMGDIVIPIEYQAIGEPSKNLIPYMNKPAEWGYMNFEGQIIVKPQFSTTWLGEKGEAYGHKDGENFIINENGTIKKID